MLGIKLEASHRLVKNFTILLHPQPQGFCFVWFVCVKDFLISLDRLLLWGLKEVAKSSRLIS